MSLADTDRSFEDPLRHTMEHRWGERIPCSLFAWIHSGPGIGGTARLRDVSLSGAFLETALDLPLLAHIDVSVTGDRAASAGKTIAANVVRRERDGIAVEWCETPGKSICSLLGCASRCLSATPLCRRPA